MRDSANDYLMGKTGGGMLVAVPEPLTLGLFVPPLVPLFASNRRCKQGCIWLAIEERK